MRNPLHPGAHCEASGTSGISVVRVLFHSVPIAQLYLPGEEKHELGKQTALARGGASYWAGTLVRNELVRKALSARFLFERDVHYLVRDGKV